MGTLICYSYDYKKLVGKMFILRQKYDNNDYRHLVKINSILQTKKNDIYQYSCSIIQTNVGFNKYYPFEAHGQFPLNLDITDNYQPYFHIKFKERLANVNFPCKEIAWDISRSQGLCDEHSYYVNYHNRIERDGDMRYIKEFKDHYLNRSFIDHNAWMKYHMLKSKHLQNAVDAVVSHTQVIAA